MIIYNELRNKPWDEMFSEAKQNRVNRVVRVLI